MDLERAIQKVADAYLGKIADGKGAEYNQALKVHADIVLDAPRDRRSLSGLIANKRRLLRSGLLDPEYEQKLTYQLEALAKLKGTVTRHKVTGKKALNSKR